MNEWLDSEVSNECEDLRAVGRHWYLYRQTSRTCSERCAESRGNRGRFEDGVSTRVLLVVEYWSPRALLYTVRNLHHANCQQRSRCVSDLFVIEIAAISRLRVFDFVDDWAGLFLS